PWRKKTQGDRDSGLVVLVGGSAGRKIALLSAERLVRFIRRLKPPAGLPFGQVATGIARGVKKRRAV
ncbi:MAG: hypothetical protein Q4G03_11390, partial [Planctomycetia bacterium]|nr:hypothetical protein [Planctomycetia bacterium]